MEFGAMVKAQELIELLQKLDPETEVGANDCQGFGCMGAIVKGIEIVKQDMTEWDHRAKKPMHTTLYQIRGID